MPDSNIVNIPNPPEKPQSSDQTHTGRMWMVLGVCLLVLVVIGIYRGLDLVTKQNKPASLYNSQNNPQTTNKNLARIDYKSSFPDNFPQDIPKKDLTEIITSFTLVQPNGTPKESRVEFTVKQTMQEAVLAYAEFFTNLGWEFDSTTMVDTEAKKSISGRKGIDLLVVTVTPTKAVGESNVQLILSFGK